MLKLYTWFLEITGERTTDVVKWISVESNQNLAKKNTEEYHDLFYNLIESTSKDLLKYYTL